MNLSWKIAGVLAGDLPESVLDTYEVERKPHAKALIQLAKFIGVAMTQGGRAGDVLRRAIAPHLHLVPGLRNRLLDSETPPLSRSDLVGRRGIRTPLNGRLCPNAPLTNDTRYDDATRGGFVLVTAVPLTTGQRAVLADRGTEVIEAAPGSALRTWLTDGKATAALVRPDFTVMRAGRDVAALCQEAPRLLRSTSPIAVRRPS
jgi:3-(3-hydroxy-phenyl)propionate hydroxylase